MRLAELLPPCLALAAASAADGGPGGPGAVQVRRSPLGSPLRQIAWAGGGTGDCDEQCRRGCLGEAAAGAPPGAAATQRAEACVAICGCGSGARRLLLLTEAGGAHVSADGGAAWRGLGELLVGQGRAPGPFRAEEIHVSGADPRRVVVLTDAAASWLSADGGASWRQVALGAAARGQRIASWLWHPSEARWAVAVAASPAAGARGPRRSGLALYTRDAGETWELLASDVEQVHWFAPPAADARGLLLARWARTVPGAAALEVLQSADFMASHAVLLGEGAPPGAPRAALRLCVRGDFAVAVAGAGAGADSGGLRLWRLEAGRGPPRFRPLAWPANAAPAAPRQLRRLSPLHALGGAALLLLPAEDPALPWGHVLACRPGSAELELVLTDLQRPLGALGAAAWQAASGVDGVFIANRAVLDRGQDLDAAERRYDAQAEEVQGGGGLPAEDDLGGSSSALASPRELFAVRTYISVNMGLAWQPLGVQAQGSPGGAKAACEQPRACHLHLALWTSCVTAPGVLAGVGNVGTRLAQDAARHGVFVSRNAGLEWRPVLDGAHIVSFLGHGDALAAVPVASPGTLRYSTNMGRTWDTVAMAAAGGRALGLQGVFAHPLHATWQLFVALASDAAPGSQLIALDLSGVLPRGCEKPADPASAASDFETWSPADALEDAHESKRPVCLLGVRTHYVRRRPERPCKTGLALRAWPFALQRDAACQCSASDWACDTGFHRAAYTAGAPCEPLEGISHPNATSLCAATTASQVQVTRGYAKPPGNRCRGGLDLSPRTEPCPQNAGLLGALRRALPRPGARPWVLLSLAALLLAAAWRYRAAGAGLAAWRPRALEGLAPALVCGRPRKGEAADDEEREFLIEGAPR